MPEFKCHLGTADGYACARAVKTQFGYHVVKVTGRRMARDYTRFMGDQIKAAKVDILLPVHDPFPGFKNS